MRREEQHCNQINHALYHLNSFEAYNRRLIAFRDEKNTNAMIKAYWYNPIKFMSIFDDVKKLTPFIYSIRYDFAMFHDGLLFYSPLMERMNDHTAAKAYSHEFLMSGLNDLSPVSSTLPLPE